MAVSRQQKEGALQKLVAEFAKSQSVVFADYRGLSVGKMSELRGKLREAAAGMTVAKKTLIGLAADQNGLGSIDPAYMEGPIAATFSYQDPLAGIKILFNFAKENEQLKLLGGVIEGKIVGPEVIQEYAKLPGREELLAKLLGSMNAPLSGMVGIMNNLIAGFVRVIDAYKDTLPSDSSPTPAKEMANESPTADEAAPADSLEVNEEKAEVKEEASTPSEAEANAEAEAGSETEKTT